LIVPVPLRLAELVRVRLPWTLTVWAKRLSGPAKVSVLALSVVTAWMATAVL
jgi:hypothetical protein